MIIFGTHPKTKTVDSGQFYCPQCQAVRPYERKSARQYFTLYFIPVFPVTQPVEFVECQHCGMTFPPAVLDRKPPEPEPDLATLLNTLGSRLAEGAPVEYLVRDLTAAGLDWDVARSTVEAQLGPVRKVCQACGLTYAAGVKVCTVCGSPLQEASRRGIV
mgnify:CR=1 FL=1